MLMVVSPSKTLAQPPFGKYPVKAAALTSPHFAADAQTLAAILRGYSEKRLMNLMEISPRLAALNAQRYADFTGGGGQPALFTFRGDVYDGLDADTLDSRGCGFAQAHLRMLSGLYGALRPLDVMEPYRLEMGVRLKNKKGRDLYAYWGDRVTQFLNEDTRGERTLVNLASREYAGVIQLKALEARLLTVDFKEKKDGTLRTVALFAKRARGRMARFAVDGRIDKAEGLKDFALDGYRFQPKLSSADRFVFAR